MRVYAIRRKGTNDYLPSRRDGKFRRRAGYSADEPILGGGEYGPRLFFKKVSAERALTAWLQGIWKATKEFHGDFGGFGNDFDIVVETEAPPAPRVRAEMEIVSFALRKIDEKPNPWCSTCRRNTAAPLFDGCMLANCPRGFEPCL
jgi:hypothetical protein